MYFSIHSNVYVTQMYNYVIGDIAINIRKMLRKYLCYSTIFDRPACQENSQA